MKYQLYTEDKNRERVKQIVGMYFSGATFFYGEGLYNGAEEKNMIIEIVVESDTPDYDLSRIKAIVSDIKAVNSQEAVMVVITKCNVPLFW